MTFNEMKIFTIKNLNVFHHLHLPFFHILLKGKNVSINFYQSTFTMDKMLPLSLTLNWIIYLKSSWIFVNLLLWKIRTGVLQPLAAMSRESIIDTRWKLLLWSLQRVCGEVLSVHSPPPLLNSFWLSWICILVDSRCPKFIGIYFFPPEQ